MRIKSKIYNIYNNLRRVVQNVFLPNKANHFYPYILSDRVIALCILLFLLSKVLFSLQLILIQQSALFADLNAQKIIFLTNEVRQQYGLSLLKENPLLDAAAKEKARDMFQNNYFSHYSPTGVSPWHWVSQAGYNYHYAGENLAINFIDSEEVVRAWLNSPSHRENILNKNYQDIGIAVLPADPLKQEFNKPIVVQLFGSPRIVKTTAPAATKPLPDTLSKPTTTTLMDKKVLGKENETASEITLATDLPSTILTTPDAPVADIVSTTTSLQKIVSAVIGAGTKTKITNFNIIIALILILMGFMVIWSVILNQRDMFFGYSEIILRSLILIFIGVAFIAFHLEQFIGPMKVV